MDAIGFSKPQPLGLFYVAINQILEPYFPRMLAELSFVPCHVELEIELKRYVFIGLSPHFRLVSPGPLPLYEITFLDAGETCCLSISEMQQSDYPRSEDSKGLH